MPWFERMLTHRSATRMLSLSRAQHRALYLTEHRALCSVIVQGIVLWALYLTEHRAFRPQIGSVKYNALC